MEFNSSDSVVNDSTNNRDCFEQIEFINNGLAAYQTFHLLVPNDTRIWTPRDEIWDIFFLVSSSILALFYMLLGISSVVLIFKKECLRLPAHTFLAIYSSMAILGFSRALYLSLDPFGILGYIGRFFPAWVIISRVLAAFGFPSLVASCTLIIFTLFKLTNAKPGKQWYESWCKVFVITAIPYVIALTTEALGHIDTYPALFFGTICEISFVLWGLSICIAFLLSGVRLLRKLKERHRKATLVSSDLNDTNFQRAECIRLSKHQKKTKRIGQKIAKITYGTAIAGILYSLASAGAVVMHLLLIFHSCMGLRLTNSIAWLVITILVFIFEIVLVVFVMYSITDTSPVMSKIRSCRMCSTQEDQQDDVVEDAEEAEQAMNQIQVTDEAAQAYESTDVVIGVRGREVDGDNGNEDNTASTIDPTKNYIIAVRGDSDSSLELPSTNINSELMEKEKTAQRLTTSHSENFLAQKSDEKSTTPNSETEREKGQEKRMTTSHSDYRLGQILDKKQKDRMSQIADTEIICRMFSLGDSPKREPSRASKRSDLEKSKHRYIKSLATSKPDHNSTPILKAKESQQNVCIQNPPKGESSLASKKFPVISNYSSEPVLRPKGIRKETSNNAAGKPVPLPRKSPSPLPPSPSPSPQLATLPELVPPQSPPPQLQTPELISHHLSYLLPPPSKPPPVLSQQAQIKTDKADRKTLN